MFFFADVQVESNGYSVLSAAEPPDGEPQTTDGCVHSSDEDAEEGAHKEEQEEERTIESHVAAHNCSGSRPLLADSEDDEEQGPQLAPHSSPHVSAAQTQPSTPFHQQQHEAAKGTDVTADVFSKAPFLMGQDDTGDVFANAPFPHAPPPAQQQFDVFSQAPFGKKKVAAGGKPKTSYPQAVQGVTPDQAVLGQVAQQPFRPQALAKYSRHFEGPVPQQQVAAHRVVSSTSRQATVASVPVGPLHSWTSEVSAVDPFISAPFPLKAPQEKPWARL